MSNLSDGTAALNASYISAATGTAVDIAHRASIIDTINSAITPYLALITISATIIFGVIGAYQAYRNRKINQLRLDMQIKDEIRKEEIHQAELKAIKDNFEKHIGAFNHAKDENPS